MGLRRLLGERRLSRERTSPEEIARLLNLADHLILNARVQGLEHDARFVLLHGAALDLALVIVRAAAFRPRGPRHHQTTFAAFGELLGRSGRAWSEYLQACRMKRNQILYEGWIEIPGPEADEYLAKLQALRELVVARVAKSSPWLLAKMPRKESE